MTQLEQYDPPAAANLPQAHVDKSDARVRRMFGEIAPRYDLLNHLLSLNVDKYWRWRTVKKVPPHGPAPILDVCTGTGDLALAYFKAAAGKADVVGADFCAPMLDIGRRKARDAGVSGGVRFVDADAQRLPFPDDTFQIVSVAFGLRNVSDTDQGVREMVRVCRGGGRVAILEFSTPRWQPFKSVYGWYFRKVLPRIGQALAANRDSAYHYLPASVAEFPSGEELAARMRAAGLRDTEIVPLTFGIATLYIGVK